MNNSLVLEQFEEEKSESTPVYRERSVELSKTIEALDMLDKSEYWKKVQTNIFRKDFDRFQKLLRTEKESIELFKLQGRLEILEKVLDTQALIKSLKNELERITSNLKQHGKES